MKFCTVCGAKIVDTDTKFCGKCGSKISDVNIQRNSVQEIFLNAQKDSSANTNVQTQTKDKSSSPSESFHDYSAQNNDQSQNFQTSSEHKSNKKSLITGGVIALIVTVAISVFILPGMMTSKFEVEGGIGIGSSTDEVIKVFGNPYNQSSHYSATGRDDVHKEPGTSKYFDYGDSFSITLWNNKVVGVHLHNNCVIPTKNGLKVGMDYSEIEKIYGKPDRIEIFDNNYEVVDVKDVYDISTRDWVRYTYLAKDSKFLYIFVERGIISSIYITDEDFRK